MLMKESNKYHLDGSTTEFRQEDLDEMFEHIKQSFDLEKGGMERAPKFPMPSIYKFLLRYYALSQNPEALRQIELSLNRIALGGIYDHVGGGWARYSVDEDWFIPHFEKMLYDNALLLRAYLHWWRSLPADSAHRPLAERVCHETADFILTELRTEQGGFASALDADSEGHEGTYYVWGPYQLSKVLGATDAPWAVELLGVTGTGTFERGLSTLQLRKDPDDPQRWAQIKAKLLEFRAKRERPERDDKVVAAWNGYAITALAETGILLQRPDLATASQEAAELLWNLHIKPGFVRTSLAGERSQNAAVLEDYGAGLEAFVAVLGATGDPVWLDRARHLADQIEAKFTSETGGWFDTASDAEELLVRPRDLTDNAVPSGSAATVHGLLALAAVTGEHRYREAAVAGIEQAADIATGAPRFAGWTLAAAEAVLAGPAEVAVVGEVGGPMHRAALALTTPGAVVVASETASEVPLLAGRTAIKGKPTAYVCRDFVCSLPVTDPAKLVG